MTISEIFECTHPLQSQNQCPSREGSVLQVCSLYGSFRWLGMNTPNIGGWNRPLLFDKLLKESLQSLEKG